MKKMKRERSVRITSTTAVSSEATALSAGAETPAASDFDAFYPWLCARLYEQDTTSPPPIVLVRRVVRQELSGKGSAKVRSAKANKSTSRLADGGGELSQVAAEVPSDTAAGAGGGGGVTLSLVAVYDARERLVEVALGGGDAGVVPSVMLRALTLSLPHQPSVVRLTVRGELDSHALRDIGDLLMSPATTLSELRLDESPLPHADWCLLVESGTLRYLSLCRCRLDNAACVALATSLCARGGLAVLDLSSNRIGDEGAESLGALLRTDRYLRYLNLSDNRIGDVGCRALLGALTEFPLTADELVAERRRRLAAARVWLELRSREMAAVPYSSAIEPLRSKGKAAAVTSSERTERANAGAIGAAGTTTRGGVRKADAKDAAPPPQYARSQTLSRGGHVFCVGNFTLCYLNLAFNALETWSLRHTTETLQTQSRRAAEAPCGLLRVVVEGNPLPPEGDDATRLEQALERRLIDVGAAVVDKMKGKK